MIKTTITDKPFSLKTIGVAFLKEVDEPKELILEPTERLFLIDRNNKTIRTFLRLTNGITPMLIQVPLWEFVASAQCQKISCKYLRLTNNKNTFNYLETFNLEPAELDFNQTADLLSDDNKYLPEDYINLNKEPVKGIISLSRPCQTLFQGLASITKDNLILQAMVPLDCVLNNKASLLTYRKVKFENELYMCDITYE